MTTSVNEIENLNEASVKPAHQILRLNNFIIDTLAWISLYLSIAYVLDLHLVNFSSYLLNYTYSISLALIVFIGYHTLTEFYFQKTLGKLITQTEVVHENGEQISFRSILIRSLSRLIPVDPFYLLLTKKGLHDRFSKTVVIKPSHNRK